MTERNTRHAASLGQLAHLAGGIVQMRIEFQRPTVHFERPRLVAILLQHARQFGHRLEMPRIEQHHFLQRDQSGRVVVRRMFHAGADVPAFGKIRRDGGDGIDQLLGGLVVGGGLGRLRPQDQEIDTGAAGDAVQGLQLLLDGVGVFGALRLFELGQQLVFADDLFGGGLGRRRGPTQIKRAGQKQQRKGERRAHAQELNAALRVIPDSAVSGRLPPNPAVPPYAGLAGKGLRQKPDAAGSRYCR